MTDGNTTIIGGKRSEETPSFFKFFNVLFIFDRERDRQTEHEWGRSEREADTESEAGSRL